MKKSLRYVALFAATSFAVGITVAPVATAAASVKLCIALDTGGVDDHSFNASAWAGAQASDKFTKTKATYLPAASTADFVPNLKKLVDNKCTIIVGVGYQIGSAIMASAAANPTVKFAIVDNDGADHGPNFDQYPGKTFPNLKALQFSTDESSFLAGYLAAGVSKTGIVATYGGAPYPSVTMFMDGYYKGVAYYNKVKGKSVKVLGWDPAKPAAGSMVGDFQNSAKAIQMSKSFEQQGADVIFPVAGTLGGDTAGNSIKSKKSLVFGVDQDFYDYLPQYKSVILSSVVKGVGASVLAVTKDCVDGKYTGTGYFGNLANKGTFLAPYREMSKKVPAKLQGEIRALQADIISGALSI